MILVNQIPNKSLFKIQEVCEICQIKPYVLRFWDSEFDQIQSISNSAGKKLYQKKDILVISVLKDLLFDRKLTIEKARLELSEVDFGSIVESQLRDFEQETDRGEILEIDAVTPTADEVQELPESTLNILESEQTKQNVLTETSLKLKQVLEQIDGLKTRYNWA